MKTEQLPDDRLALSINEACVLIGVGRDTLYDFIRERKLAARKIGGRRTIILRGELERFLRNLPPAALTARARAAQARNRRAAA
jgi:excisionase family DNA binding protein